MMLETGAGTAVRRSMIWVCSVLLSALGVLAGCGGTAEPAGGPAAAETPVPRPTAEPVQEPEPEPVLPYVHPLTGVGTETPAAGRPFAVMVENAPAARPQTGLHLADIVYEVLAEGEITRFIAFYHSETAEEIGPVRSIRPYFVELGMAMDAILIHAGWSQAAMNLITKHKLNHLDQVYGDHDYFWRDNSRKKPHNVYTSSELLKKGAEARNFRTDWTDPGLMFAEPNTASGAGAADAAPPSGSTVPDGSASPQGASPERALKVTIPYIAGYEVEYEYDESSGVYLRTMAGKEHTDKLSGERLSAANVLIVETKHRIVDNIGRREIDVQGPGKGILLQGGAAKRITWRLAGGMIRPYEDEEMTREIPLMRGKTWVQIVPDADKVSFS